MKAFARSWFEKLDARGFATGRVENLGSTCLASDRTGRAPSQGCNGNHIVEALLEPLNPVHFSPLKRRRNGCQGGQTMSSERAKEFDQYACECVRLADGVKDPDLREKLLRQAREWMQAE